jgi:peptidyl-prolyl cis-trans isomerase C
MKCFLIPLTAVFAYGQATPPAAPPADPVIITIGDQKITKSQFEQILGTLNEQQRAQIQAPGAKRKLAENYVELVVLAREAHARKIDQSEKVKTEIAIQSQRVLAQNLVDEAFKPDDAEMHAYYDSHKGDWEELKARHILIRFKGSKVAIRPNQKDLTEEEALAKAQEIRAKIVAGGDFAKLAETESDDVGNASHGGDLGSFGKGRMVPEFDKAAFAAELGKVTEPVKTQFGYHLILVESREPKPFADVRAEIERKLKPEIAQKNIADLKKKTTIVLDDAYFGK